MVAVGRYHLPVIVIIGAALLAIAAAVREVAVPAMTFTIRILNAAMQHAGQVGRRRAWMKQAVP
jgi:hypothetical protein